MEITFFLAQFLGWYLVIMGLIVLVRGRVFLEELLALIEDKGFLLFGGYLALFLGLTTVILHNVWVADWRVTITIFGWLSLVKGVLLIGFPRSYASYVRFVSVLKNKPMLIRIWAVSIGLLGAWLVWMSY